MQERKMRKEWKIDMRQEAEDEEMPALGSYQASVKRGVSD